MGVILDVPAWVFSLLLEAPGAPSPPNPMARISANTFNSFPVLASAVAAVLLLFELLLLFALASRLDLRPGLPDLGFGSFPPLPFPLPLPVLAGSVGGFSSAFGMLSLLGRNQRIVDGIWIVGV